MSSNYFAHLLTLARKVDVGIEELSQIWKFPQFMIAGDGTVTEEASAYLESLKESVQLTQNEMKDILLSMKSQTEETNKELQDISSTYESLENKIKDLESVFEEFGYHYDPNKEISLSTKENTNLSSSNRLKCIEDIPEDTKGIEDIEDIQNIKDTEDIEDIEDIEVIEVAFTPDLGWRYKKKSIEKVTPLKENVIPSESVEKKILSDVTASVKSHTKYFTPLRERLTESVYSAHFFGTKKK